MVSEFSRYVVSPHFNICNWIPMVEHQLRLLGSKLVLKVRKFSFPIESNELSNSSMEIWDLFHHWDGNEGRNSMSCLPCSIRLSCLLVGMGYGYVPTEIVQPPVLGFGCMLPHPIKLQFEVQRSQKSSQ